MGIQTQVLALAQQALYWAIYLPGPVSLLLQYTKKEQFSLQLSELDAT